MHRDLCRIIHIGVDLLLPQIVAVVTIAKYPATMPRTLPPANGSRIVPPEGQNQLYISSHNAGSNMLVPGAILSQVPEI